MVFLSNSFYQNYLELSFSISTEFGAESLEVRIVKLFVRLSIIAWISEGMSFDTFGFVYPWVQIGFLDSLLNRSVVPQGVSRRSKPHWCGSRRMVASHE